MIPMRDVLKLPLVVPRNPASSKLDFTAPGDWASGDVESKLPLSARVARLLASTSQSYQVQQSFCGDIQLHLTNANANAIRQALTSPSRSHVCSALQSSINWGPPIFLCLESSQSSLAISCDLRPGLTSNLALSRNSSTTPASCPELRLQ